MPTYDMLAGFFAESSFPATARAAAEVPIVAGFALDVDPLWCLLYDIEEGTLDPALWTVGGLPTDYRYWLDRMRQGEMPQAPLLAAIADRFQGFRPRDLYRPVKGWDELPFDRYSDRRRRHPVIMTIVHRPLRPASDDRKEGDIPDLRRLVALARAAEDYVRIEERPPARLAFAPGDRIALSSGVTGTLGGVLDGADGLAYGVTCSHVARRGDKVSDTQGHPLGTCVAHTALQAMAQQQVCDPVNLRMPSPAPGNGPDLNMLDCALIELAAPVNRPQLGGIAPHLSYGQNVTMRGAQTGTTRHKLGSLCLSYQFNDGGQDFCFRNAIELLPQPRGPFGGAIGRMLTMVPTQGDSGAFVLTDATPPDWAGLFFGEDGNRGFAVRASWVHDWAEQAAGTVLTV